ncbi:unnamed protein product [Cuscuta epithymum]|uniref:Transmembrane protein n=1 Tax=Cuscuta epithymum TaxID=186058 RepID=A0AAV0C6V4_9ASTE|nr:unnamed protein product [Cuscuta epithymum]
MASRMIANCDLPPPRNVFSGAAASLEGGRCWENEEVDILLEALRLSQTRARVAERRYRLICKERDSLSNLLLEDSLRLLACQNSIRLLELQASQMEDEQNKYKTADNSVSALTWFMAKALCVGIAGVTLAFGSIFLFLT